jgi:multiple sugar transport system substrate-binding protein
MARQCLRADVPFALRMRCSYIFAFLLLFAGCSAPSTERETLRFWTMGREGEVVQQLLPEFERRNPGIRVRVQQVPWSSAHEKLLTAYAGGTLPDVCQLGNTWIPEFAALQALAPLDKAVASSRSISSDDYFKGIWDTNVIGGALLGVPWYVDTRLLFYRSDLLKQAGIETPPATWDEWAQAMAVIKESTGPGRYAILLPLNEPEPLIALGLQQSEPLLRDGGRWGHFSSTGFRKALAFYANVFERGWAPAIGGAQISNVWSEFGRGRFAFYISGPWNIGEFRRRLPPEQQHNWMTAPLPGPNGVGASTAGGSSLVVFRNSQKQQAAWRLIEYLSEPDVQLRFHELTGNLPPRRSVWQDDKLARDRHAQAFRDQLERVKSAPKVPEWERIVSEMQAAAESVVRGRMGVEEAARVLDRKVDAILEKRRWLLSRATRG